MKVPVTLMFLVTLPCLHLAGCASPHESSESRRERSIEAAATGLDRANGAAWLPAVAAAERADDEAMRLSILPALARTQYVAVYWNTLIVHLTRAVVGAGDLSTRDALTEIIGLVAVGTIPAYRAVSQLCSGARLDDRATLRDCRAVAMALERGDTDITQMEGANTAVRLWPEDSAEWLAAREIRRVHEYRVGQLAHTTGRGFPDERAATEFLA